MEVFVLFWQSGVTLTSDNACFCSLLPQIPGKKQNWST